MKKAANQMGLPPFFLPWMAYSPRLTGGIALSV